jgi:hypothetical protein
VAVPSLYEYISTRSGREEDEDGRSGEEMKPGSMMEPIVFKVKVIFSSRSDLPLN